MLTVYGANRAVQAGLGGAVSALGDLYLGLLTNRPPNPGMDSLAVYASYELTTSGYSRQVITFSGPTCGSMTNAASILFGPFGSDTPDVLYAFTSTAASGTSGDVLAIHTMVEAVHGHSGAYIGISEDCLVGSVGAFA